MLKLVSEKDGLIPLNNYHFHSIFTTKRQRGDIMSLKKMDRIDCRINLSVKILSKEVCKDLGMSLTEAINIFLHQMIIHHGLPFEVRMSAEDRKLFVLPDEEDAEDVMVEEKEKVIPIWTEETPHKNLPIEAPLLNEAVIEEEAFKEDAFKETAGLEEEPVFEGSSVAKGITQDAEEDNSPDPEEFLQ
jgi:DNA-damage-inducible protein J